MTQGMQVDGLRKKTRNPERQIHKNPQASLFCCTLYSLLTLDLKTFRLVFRVSGSIKQFHMTEPISECASLCRNHTIQPGTDVKSDTELKQGLKTLCILSLKAFQK